MPSQEQIQALQATATQRLRDRITELEAENVSLKARLPKSKSVTPKKKTPNTKK